MATRCVKVATNMIAKKNKRQNINTFYIFFQMSCIRKSKGLWLVRCMMRYEYVIIGEYKTEAEAVDAYNNFVLIHKLNRKLKNIKK
jgi:hypothetical protein